AGDRAGPPDYASTVTSEGQWNRVSLEAPAPEGAAVVTIQLTLANAPQGTVWWDDISFDEIPAPKPRLVTIASVHSYPAGKGSVAEGVRQFLELIPRVAPARTDLIVLPEVINLVGTRLTGRKAVVVAEPIPGPTTSRLAEMAKGRNSYIAASLYERE